MFSKFVPPGYDVYVFGVQEAVSDSVFDAFAKYTGTYRLPLNAKLVPAREQTDKNKARSRRMGRALNAADLMKDEKKGRKVTPASSAADMVRALTVYHRHRVCVCVLAMRLSAAGSRLGSR